MHEETAADFDFEICNVRADTGHRTLQPGILSVLLKTTVSLGNLP